MQTTSTGLGRFAGRRQSVEASKLRKDGLGANLGLMLVTPPFAYAIPTNGQHAQTTGQPRRSNGDSIVATDSPLASPALRVCWRAGPPVAVLDRPLMCGVRPLVGHQCWGRGQDRRLRS